MLRDGCRFEAAFSVARHLQINRTDIGRDRVGIAALTPPMPWGVRPITLPHPKRIAGRSCDLWSHDRAALSRLMISPVTETPTCSLPSPPQISAVVRQARRKTLNTELSVPVTGRQGGSRSPSRSCCH